jgi:hypothetical protein
MAKPDPAGVLAEKMLRELEARRGRGGGQPPLSLKRLAELADPQATPALVAKAARKRTFQQQAVIANAKSPDAPVALAADLDALAGSPLVLEFLLRAARTVSNQAFSVSGLEAKAAGKLKKPLRAALNRHLDAGTLPPTVGWVTINRSKRLFLLEDLHVGGREERQGDKVTRRQGDTEPEPPVTLSPGHLVSLSSDFDAAFAQLDRQAGGHNFVSLVELRRTLPLPRDAFDAELRRLRLTGRYSLSAAEGRHGLSAEEQQAGIVEDGTLLLYVSRKSS